MTNQERPIQPRPVLIAEGGDFSRRKSISPLVISKCSLILKSTDYISECEKAFVQFERILSQRPDSEIAYEWAHIYRDGLLITFDINWYDLNFFHERKYAYRVGPHAFAFQRFGAVADDFTIVHEFAKDRLGST